MMSCRFSYTVGKAIRTVFSGKPVRTVALQFLVALFTCVFIGGTVISQGIGRGAQMMVERLGADILFVPDGYQQNSQDALLRGEPCSFYLPAGLDVTLRSYPEVKQATAQLFVASLQATCCAVHVQLIGIDADTDFVVGPWMAQRGDGNILKDRALGSREIIVGSQVDANPGDTVRLFGKEFFIVAKLDASGMGFDTSVFMASESIRNLLRESEYRSALNLPEGFDAANYASSVLVKLHDGVNAEAFAHKVITENRGGYKLDFVSVDKMLSGVAGKMKNLTFLLYGLAAMLWLAAILMLGLVFSMTINSRHAGAIVRKTGDRKQHTARVCKETMAIGLVGGLGGVCVAGVVLYAFDSYIRATLQLPSLTPDKPTLLVIGLIGIAASILTGPIACLPAMLRREQTS